MPVQRLKPRERELVDDIDNCKHELATVRLSLNILGSNPQKSEIQNLLSRRTALVFKIDLLEKKLQELRAL